MNNIISLTKCSLTFCLDVISYPLNWFMFHTGIIHAEVGDYRTAFLIVLSCGIPYLSLSLNVGNGVSYLTTFIVYILIPYIRFSIIMWAILYTLTSGKQFNSFQEKVNSFIPTQIQYCFIYLIWSLSPQVRFAYRLIKPMLVFGDKIDYTVGIAVAYTMYKVYKRYQYRCNGGNGGNDGNDGNDVRMMLEYKKMNITQI